MIKVGKILIDPNSIDTILCLDPKFNAPDRERGIHRIQIIYKSGVVKNTTSSEVAITLSKESMSRFNSSS